MSDWLQAARLLAAVVLTAALGLHAYQRHRREIAKAVSPRKWMYWFYAMVFALACTANVTQFCITVVFRSYQRASFHLGYSTLLLMLSYTALLAGATRAGRK